MIELNDNIQIISSLAELEDYTRSLARILAERSIILLKGPLGVGKTKTVEYLLKQRGYSYVASPTFALHRLYQLEDFTIHHFDLYRIENEDDLETTGFWDVFSNESGWVIVEWADRINVAHLPMNWQVIEIDIEFAKKPQSEVREFRLQLRQPFDQKK
ncbi:MAG: tRNA (adenosine(37)-N6)-threonylcarbamoyltransferase complex ATPase subunit type 1 TsaE [Bdellovibrionales bacterium RBG_16_40_8]|nr:MAG: tRNA (adenosine(37)-N6)-threonylcarbamoyltransferase complex ATPase subunit type 1 TsaE [Bdellovibrionales bacterium RBG_16_40_8]